MLYLSLDMKGIILAGGTGSRLFPLTLSLSKQLMPVYDKPMIYYPLSVLMLAGIREILIITTASDFSNFKKLFGDGKQLGCQFEYAIQSAPNGLAEAFIIGESFIKNDAVALILGDNIFYGTGLRTLLRKQIQIVNDVQTLNQSQGVVFAYHVNNPQRYGVVDFDNKNRVLSIEEKPEFPKSNYVVPGIYFYDNKVIERAKKIVPSSRGELEITDLNNFYLKENELNVGILDRGSAWLDTGTFDSLIEAGQFVQVIERRQGLKIGCIEEIAYKEGYINEEALENLIQPLLKSGYGQYLLQLLKDKS